jgi:ribosomal protein S18 acetylase RimI-like enzyme
MIRPAEQKDVPAIVQLLADDPHGRQRETPEDLFAYRKAFAEIDSDQHNLLAVIELGGREIAGCIQLTFIPGLSHRGAWRCLVEDVRISSDHRRQGFGRALLVWAIEQAAIRGCSVVQLFMHRDREGARQLYGGLGFRQEHDGFRLTLN